jgi:hypothetical protein
VLVTSAAQGDTSFAGQWSASGLVVAWKIGDWGAACGPKPSGGGEPGGTATIQQVGPELAISGLGHAFKTGSCWEQLPGVVPRAHSTSPSFWQTTCKSPSDDPRQSTLVTTLSAKNPNQLSFDETGQYQFVIKGQNCTASVRRNRSFKRILPSDSAPGPTPALLATTPPAVSSAAPARGVTAAEPAPTPPTPTPKASSCALPGPPSRIELRPSHKLIRPGDSFAFGAAVLDAHGCALGLSPTFRLEGEATGVTVSQNGKVSVADDAAERELQVVAAVGARAVKASLTIVSRERYDAMLAQGSYDATGASADAAVARFESGSMGSHSTVIEDDSGRKRALFVGILGVTALGLGLLGLMLVRRGRRAATQQGELRPAAPRTASTRPPTVCPTCRDEYPPDAQFCPKDGNRLLPLERGAAVGPSGAVCPVCGQGYDPGVSVCPKHDEPLVPPVVYASTRSTTVVESRKICPVCGAQYGGESQFCGACGAALVPVN